MGKTDNEGFLDIWELDHSKYSTDSDEDVVTEGADGDVTEVPIDPVPETKAEEPEEKAEENDEDEDAESGEEVLEEGAEKQAEEEEDGKEDASVDETETEDVGFESLLQDLAKDDILSFDQDKEYEMSSEGLKELINETVEKKTTEALESYKNDLPEKARELLGLLEKGASVDDFINMDQETNFADVPLERDGKPIERNQQYIIEDWLKVQGYNNEEIQETLSGFKESGMLSKQAEFAKNKLVAWQTNKQEALVKQREEEKANQLAEETKAATEFEKEVTSTRDIAGFSITAAKAKKLHEFITKPNKDGKTEFQLKDSDENRLLYAYMAMEGFDKDKLIRKEKSQEALKLKKKLSQFKDGNAKPKRGGEQVRKTQSDDVVKRIKWLTD